MENILKGAHLLKEMDQKSVNEIEKDALLVWQEFHVIFKVFKVSEKDINLGVTQMKTDDGQYLDQKRLIQLTHNTLKKYFRGLNIHVRPSVYQESPALKVDYVWIKKKMDEYGVQLKDIVADTGLNKTQLSVLINGGKPLSDAMKAMFYFYFKTKEKKDNS